MLDTGSGRRFDWRGDEMFPMCSTFKFLLAAAILRRVDEGRESLTRRIPVSPGDLIPYAPFAETRVNGTPPTVAELCEATMTLSDNVAANLLLPAVGDPAGLTAFVFGPGHIAQAHTADEWVALDQLATVAAHYQRLLG